MSRYGVCTHTYLLVNSETFARNNNFNKPSQNKKKIISYFLVFINLLKT